MRVVVIGGTGHVGTYLVPRLVESGHEVITVARGRSQPYQHHAAWNAVRSLVMDRSKLEATGQFGQKIRDIGPDIVIDMICFTLDSARQLVEALRDHVRHFLHCGTIWVHGHNTQVPTTEDQPRKPFGQYGSDKARIEEYLLREDNCSNFPSTILHPGHIVGHGWPPLNPAGHFNIEVFERLARSEELALPNLGMETVHHVHADDVAEAFMKAIANHSSSVGESFHVVSPAALTLRGYAEAMAAWFGQEPNLKFMPWEQWKATVSDQDADYTWDHIAHSPNCSIAKATRLLDYHPCYTSLQAVFESVNWLIAQGKIRMP